MDVYLECTQSIVRKWGIVGMCLLYASQADGLD